MLFDIVRERVYKEERKIEDMERTGIVYGLLVAVSWGVTDTLGTLVARKIGSLLTTFFSLLASVVILMLYGVFTGQIGHVLALPHTTLLLSIPIGIFTGFCAAIGYFSLYQGLERGPLAIVSPLVASDGAIAALLAVFFLGDALTSWQIGLLLCIFSGIVCASTDVQELRAVFRPRGAEVKHVGKGGIRWGLLATVAFGLMLFSIGATSKIWGEFWPIFCARVFATVFLAGVVGYQKYVSKGRHMQERPSHGPLPLQAVSLAATMGMTETVGLLFYSFGTAQAETSVVASISSCFGLIPLAVGLIVFHERPKRVQILGVLLVIGGLVLLAVKPA